MKLKLYTLFLLTSISLTSQKKEIAELYKTDIFEAAIFPVGNNETFPIPDFTPSHAEIDLAEEALLNDLEQLNFMLINQSDTPVIHKNLNKYCRQYIGYIDKNGDKILLINCFWKTKNKEIYKNFLKRWISIYDGGSFYWNIKYNLTKKKLFGLSVNGYS